MSSPVSIVLVEDNPNDERLALRALKKSGLSNEVTVLRDGEEAIAFFLGEGGGPRADPALTYVLLLDLQLPKLNGVDVLRALRADPTWRLMTVVILTASEEERDRIQSYGLGANSYIRKPIDFDQFVDVVRQVGYYWLVLNEPPPPPSRVERS